MVCRSGSCPDNQGMACRSEMAKWKQVAQEARVRLD
jgi:hypothetical protein